MRGICCQFLRPMLVLALVFLLSGCSLLGLGGYDFVKPEVQLEDLRFENVTLFSTALVVTVRIDNENDFPLKIDGGSHRVYLNGSYIGKGISDESVEIPRLGSEIQEIKVSLSNFSMLTKIASLVEQEKLEYKIDSSLFVSRGLGSHRVKTSSEGTFAFPEGTRPRFQLPPQGQLTGSIQ